MRLRFFCKYDVSPFLLFFSWLVLCIGIPGTIHRDFREKIEYEKEVHKYYIESLGNDKYMEGVFFLGNGYVMEKDYYFFYVNTSNGYQRLKIPVESTYLIETDERRPEYVQIYRDYNDDKSFWKVLPDCEKYNKLYVPKGTIVRDFRVR
ncbi:hypothetical protein [Tenacibaculum dicentrarchi]|uniref:Uncharacterized protein n=1 Tax=Tenacibaculum dicentrarchi TaxID=669041 RepID=A0ABM9NXD3_9FLAO